MRYGIIADIHANLPAFTAVMSDMERRGEIAELWCLGDIVGYGPNPRECIELLRKYNHVSVAGNHDWASIGKLDTFYFNPDAAVACRWTGQRLMSDDIDYLGNLPTMLQKEGFTLVHGSPRDPLHEYLLSERSAEENLLHLKSPFCLVGHSHVPLVILYNESGQASLKDFSTGEGIELNKIRLIINPGSVGQPRNGDPRASYAIYDSELMRVENYRVPYDIEEVQARMMHFALPPRLISRLSFGA